MGKHYQDEIGTNVLVNVGTDISTAITTNLKVKKPSGAIATWAASVVNSNYLSYDSEVGDLDEVGRYELQASLVIGGWTGLGETDSFIIYDPYA